MRKKLWEYKIGMAYNDFKQGLTYYDNFLSDRHGLLFLKVTCYGNNRDSMCASLIDIKTGKEKKCVFLATYAWQTAPEYLFTNDSSHFFFLRDSLSYYDTRTLQKLWSIDAKPLHIYDGYLNSSYFTVKTDSINVYTIDNNSAIHCFDKNTGHQKWAQNLGASMPSPDKDFILLNGFAIVHCKNAENGNKASTHIINLTNPNDYALVKPELVLLGEDLNAGVIYLIDKTNLALLKVKLP